jgi:hypothetical protein
MITRGSAQAKALEAGLDLLRRGHSDLVQGLAKVVITADVASRAQLVDSPAGREPEAAERQLARRGLSRRARLPFLS